MMLSSKERECLRIQEIIQKPLFPLPNPQGNNANAPVLDAHLAGPAEKSGEFPELSSTS